MQLNDRKNRQMTFHQCVWGITTLKGYIQKYADAIHKFDS